MDLLIKTFLGFSYEYPERLKTDAEKKQWLKAKLLRYVFNMKEGVDMKTNKQVDSLELQILKEILMGDYN